MDINNLQELLHKEIPITDSLGIKLDSYNSKQLLLKAPLSKNINVHSTAFAGSQSAIAIAAGWSFVYANFEDWKESVVNSSTFSSAAKRIDATIVAAEASIKYLLPVTGNFVAKATFDFNEVKTGLHDRLLEGKNFHLQLKVQLICGGKVCAKANIRFVFVPQK